MRALADGVLVGWEGHLGNADRHHKACHAAPSGPEAAPIGALQAWAVNHVARMLQRKLDLVSDGIAVAEQQSVDDADGCASQRVSVEHGVPEPGEVVQFQPRKRISSKGVCSWRAEATGASCWQDTQLLVELKIHPIADAVWRPAAEVARERTAVRRCCLRQPVRQ